MSVTMAISHATRVIVATDLYVNYLSTYTYLYDGFECLGN